MPISIPEALGEAQQLARVKSSDVRKMPRYLLSSVLAGAYVGVAVVLLLSIAGPLFAAGSPFTKLIQGAVFGIALTLVVFAGAELFTGNNMFMIQGWLGGTVRLRDLGAVWLASLVGNVVGSIGFAGLVHAGGTIAAGATADTPAPAQGLLTAIIDAKNLATGPQLFMRAVLCNVLVCLALWMASRTRSDTAKLMVLWWALLAFIASGFEHSIANVTTFSLGIFQGTATWSDMMRNLLWTIPGNVIGGGLLVGAVYAYLGGSKRADAEIPPALDPYVSIRPEDAVATAGIISPQVGEEIRL